MSFITIFILAALKVIGNVFLGLAITAPVVLVVMIILKQVFGISTKQLVRKFIGGGI